MPRAVAAAPKGISLALPARGQMLGAACKPARQAWVSGRRVANRGRSVLVAMSHGFMDNQKGHSTVGKSVDDTLLQGMRNKVASLDEELQAAQTLLSTNESARAQETEQLAALQQEMASLQAQWAADQAALQHTQDIDVEESDAALREAQGQAVQLGDRVSKLQTLLLNQDESLAELRAKLRAVKPQLATVGAAGSTANLDDDVMASFRSGMASRPEPRFEGGLGLSWDLGSAPGPASPGARPEDGDKAKKAMLRKPEALGVTVVAATMAAANAAGGIWGTVRRVAPKKMRRPLDFLASAVGVSIVAASAVLLG